MSLRSDQELLAAYVAGDDRAFHDLAERYAAMVHATCRRRLHGGVVDDAVQAVFLVLARKAAALARSAEPLGPWLFTVAGHVANNHQRMDRRRQRRQEETAMAPPVQPDPDAAWADVRAHLDAALDDLSPGYRQALVLYYLEGHDRHEVGTALGLRIEAVKKRLSRGLELLRRALERRGVTLPAVALAALLPLARAEAAPTTLVAVAAAAGSGHATPAATTLSHGAFTAMHLHLTTTIVSITLTIAVGVTALGGGIWRLAAQAGEHPPAAQPAITVAHRLEAGSVFWYASMLRWHFTADQYAPNVMGDLLPEDMAEFCIYRCQARAGQNGAVGLEVRPMAAWRAFGPLEPLPLGEGDGEMVDTGFPRQGFRIIQRHQIRDADVARLDFATGTVVLEVAPGRVAPLDYRPEESHNFGPVCTGLGLFDLLHPLPDQPLVAHAPVALAEGSVSWVAGDAAAPRLAYAVPQFERSWPKLLQIEDEFLGMRISAAVDIDGKGRMESQVIQDTAAGLPSQASSSMHFAITLRAHMVGGQNPGMVSGVLDLSRTAWRIADPETTDATPVAIPALLNVLGNDRERLSGWAADTDMLLRRVARGVIVSIETPPTIEAVRPDDSPEAVVPTREF